MKKDNNGFLAVAKVLKPQGIQGEVKVLPLTDSPENLSDLTIVNANGKQLTVNKISVHGEFCYIKFKEINDRNSAELLRDAEITVDSNHRPKLDDGRFYISDVIGCKLVAEGGKTLGTIDDILQYGSADIYSVNAQIPYMFPAVDEVIIDYDVDNGIVHVNENELKKVAVYEDWRFDFIPGNVFGAKRKYCR